MLDSSELAAAIDAFRTAQQHQGQTPGADATPAQPVTA
jgi:hypothetical protein